MSVVNISVGVGGCREAWHPHLLPQYAWFLTINPMPLIEKEWLQHKHALLAGIGAPNVFRHSSAFIGNNSLGYNTSLLHTKTVLLTRDLLYSIFMAPGRGDQLARAFGSVRVTLYSQHGPRIRARHGQWQEVAPCPSSSLAHSLSVPAPSLAWAVGASSTPYPSQKLNYGKLEFVLQT